MEFKESQVKCRKDAPLVTITSTSTSISKTKSMDKENTDMPTDWKKCVLCQDNAKIEKLTKHENNMRNDNATGYTSLANDLKKIDSIGMMPMGINMSQFIQH
jgi:hypothetical protein